MGANYKAAGRVLSPLRPKVRVEQNNPMLSATIDTSIVLCTSVCVWSFAHACSSTVVAQFEEILCSILMLCILAGNVPKFRDVVLATSCCWGGCLVPSAMAVPFGLGLGWSCIEAPLYCLLSAAVINAIFVRKPVLAIGLWTGTSVLRSRFSCS